MSLVFYVETGVERRTVRIKHTDGNVCNKKCARMRSCSATVRGSSIFACFFATYYVSRLLKPAGG